MHCTPMNILIWIMSYFCVVVGANYHMCPCVYSIFGLIKVTQNHKLPEKNQQVEASGTVSRVWFQTIWLILFETWIHLKSIRSHKILLFMNEMLQRRCAVKKNELCKQPILWMNGVFAYKHSIQLLVLMGKLAVVVWFMHN